MKCPLLRATLPLALAVSACFAGNLIENGAFDQGVEPWQGNCTDFRADDGSNSGPGCAELAAEESAGAALWQTVAVVPGARYRAAVALRTPPGSSPGAWGWAAVAWADPSGRHIRLDGFAETKSTAAWVGGHRALAAPQGAVYAAFYVGLECPVGANGTLRVDDAALVELADPSHPGAIFCMAPDGRALHLADLCSGDRTELTGTAWPREDIDRPENVAGMAWHDGLLFVAESQGRLFAVEPADGFAGLVGETGLPNVQGLAHDPVTAGLLAVTGGSLPRLFAIDPMTADAQPLGPASLLVRGIAFDPWGRLWGLDTVRPGRILPFEDPEDAVQTGEAGLIAMDFSPVTGALYAQNERDGMLYLVDPATGKICPLGPTAAARDAAAVRAAQPGHSVGPNWTELEAGPGGIGTIIRVHADTCLTGFSQGWTFLEPQEVRFGVYEEEIESHRYRLIGLSKALTHRAGGGMWPSGPLMARLRAGRRYALITFHSGRARYHCAAPPWGVFPFGGPLAGAAAPDAVAPPNWISPAEYSTGIVRTTARTDLPGSVWLYVDCEKEEPGSPIGTDGPFAAEPSGTWDGLANVEDHPVMGRSLRVFGRKGLFPYVYGGPWFELYGRTLIPAGHVVVRFDALRETDEGFSAWITQGGLLDTVTSLYFERGGVSYYGHLGMSYRYIGPYDVGRIVRVRLVYDLDHGTCSVYLNGVRRLEDEPFDVPVRGVKTLILMSLDNRDVMSGTCFDNVCISVARDDDADGDGLPDIARFTSVDRTRGTVGMTVLANGTCSAFQLLGADRMDDRLWRPVDQVPARGVSGFFRLSAEDAGARERFYRVRCVP